METIGKKSDGSEEIAGSLCSSAFRFTLTDSHYIILDVNWKECLLIGLQVLHSEAGGLRKLETCEY